MNSVFRLFLRDDIDNTGYRLTAIEDRAASLNDLNALNAACRDCIEIVLAAPCNWIAVHEHECTTSHAAYIQFIRHRSHRCAVRSESFVSKAIHFLKHI